MTTSHILGLLNHSFDFLMVYVFFSSTHIPDQIYFLLWSIELDVLEFSISNKRYQVSYFKKQLK